MNRLGLLQGLASGSVKPVGLAASAGRAAKAYDNKATSIQDALVNLIGTDGAGTDTFRTKASRMAASPEALIALKGVPAVAALAGLGMKDEDESFANQAMDLLGMGAGLYGINRGINRIGGTTAGAVNIGNPFVQAGAYTLGALGGNIGVDVIQSAL